MKIDLVQTTTKDDLILNGLFIDGNINKPAVILIHGFTSDFYTHKFFHAIQETLRGSNISSVAIQTRGTGIKTEFLKSNRKDGLWLGSFYEKLEDAHLDITAWIEFLISKGYKEIILLGHSLGTLKTVSYLIEGKYKDIIKRIVLLAPFDKNGSIERLTNGKWKEYVKIANQKCIDRLGQEIIPEFYDEYPMSYQNYASWYSDTEFNCMWDFYRHSTYDFPTLNKILIPVEIIVGDKDDCFYISEFSNIENTKIVLQDNIRDLEFHLIDGSEHTYVGFEEEVSKLVSDFIVSN